MFLIPAFVHQAHISSIRVELEQMLITDQRGRDEYHQAIEKYSLSSPEVLKIWKKQNLIDQANMKKLIKIIDRFGWPKKSVYGERAAEAAFLVLQHADLSEQERFLSLFRSAAEAGEADLIDLALLEDRILINKGKKQKYGTQVRRDTINGVELLPIEDEINVDNRRAKMGMQPLSEYLRGYGIDYKRPTKAPTPTAVVIK